jgi:hypothetical protein
MDPSQRSKLNQYIEENDTKDFTDSIRASRRSVELRRDVDALLRYKSTSEAGFLKLMNPAAYAADCAEACPFISVEMANIFEKLRDDKLDMSVFWQFVATLESIESGDIDQHEASYQIGQLLKSMYIDKVIGGSKPKNPITWADWKRGDRS